MKRPTKIDREARIANHWLYGKQSFVMIPEKEHSCAACTHNEVCRRDCRDFCLNFMFGTSEGYRQGWSCHHCLHHVTRFCQEEDERVPCFVCKHFLGG